MVSNEKISREKRLQNIVASKKQSLENIAEEGEGLEKATSNGPYEPLVLCALLLTQLFYMLFSAKYIYLTWIGQMVNPASVPDIELFNALVYAFLGGIIGSSIYTIYRVYKHVVFPCGADANENCEEVIKEYGTSKEDLEETEHILEEKRRFSSRIVLYWFVRPILGGMLGFTTFFLVNWISGTFQGVSTQDECSGRIIHGAYFILALIAGFGVGDVMLFLERKSKEIFKIAEEEGQSDPEENKNAKK